jgi:hypothetical protein
MADPTWLACKYENSIKQVKPSHFKQQSKFNDRTGYYESASGVYFYTEAEAAHWKHGELWKSIEKAKANLKDAENSLKRFEKRWGNP